MDFNPNLEIENYILEGVDTNVAGPSESKESLLIELETNQSIETTKLKNNNDGVETFELENNNIIETIIQDEESEKNHYKCKFCSQIFDKHQALGGHMNGHSKDQRNLEKFGKVTTWIHATYPPLQNTTLASEAKLQDIPSNEVVCNSYNHPEVGNVYTQLGGQRTTQQSTQQILPQGLQIHQQQPQYYQTQEPQHYLYSQGHQSCQALENTQRNQALQSPQNYQAPQGFQSYQALESTQRNQALQSPQNYQAPQGLQSYQALESTQRNQALQSPQNYQAPQALQNYQTFQGLQNYQTPQGLQNYQPSQGSQSYQTSQQFQNYHIPQESQYYQTLQGSQNNQAPQEPQYYQTPQRFQNDQTLQGPQSYQTPKGSQSYQGPQESQIYQASQNSQYYHASQKSQSNQILQGPQQLVTNDNHQQNINLKTSTTSNKPTSRAKIPSNEKKNDLSKSQDLHFQEEAQGPQIFMPNPHNVRHGDRLTTGIFIREDMNKQYYGQLEPNVLRRRNQMISTTQNYSTLAQYKPSNSPNTSSSVNQSKEE